MEFIEKDPLISVLLPVRNNGEHLPECLQSLLFQNYKNIEIIAIDDASTDNAMQILSAFDNEDKRLKVYRNIKQYGLGVTLNRAIRKARGKFVVFMDPEDTVTANKFQKQMDFLLNNPKVAAVGTQCVYINNDNKRIGKSSFPQEHSDIAQTPLHGVSVLVKGIMINRYRIPKDLLHFPANRNLLLYSDIAIRLTQYGELVNLPEFLHFHRKKNVITSKTRRALSLFKFWVGAKLNHDIPLPFLSFFSGILRPTT